MVSPEGTPLLNVYVKGVVPRSVPFRYCLAVSMACTPTLKV